MSKREDKIVKLTGLKKAMAKQMIRSWSDVPQFQLESELRCDRMIAFRKEQDYKLSYTAILAKAIAVMLEKYPVINASWAADHIVEHGDVNVGIATDTKRGLLVPVIRDANKKSLKEIQEELNVIKSKSERGNFQMEDLQGGTFTLSNLGMYRIHAFGSIVNAPEAGILAVGKMQKTPVVGENDAIEIAQIMRPVLSLDHRVTDGATGARFLTELMEVLEAPEKL